MFTNVSPKSWRDLFYIIVDKTFPFLVFTAIALWSIIGAWTIVQVTNTSDISIHSHTFQQRALAVVCSEPKFSKTFCPRNPIAEEEPVLEGEALYKSYILEIVENYYPNLDAQTIMAIVYHESRFQPDAVNSRTGATGLMQVLPKWHKDRAARLGVTDLSDPYGSLLVGCDILNEVYQQKSSMSYAVDVFAGGYSYANYYKNSVSPYRADLNKILQEHILGKE